VGSAKGVAQLIKLVRLESFVKEAFVHGKHAVAVCFDLEKAYNTTFKRSIRQDLENSGLKGHFHIFITNFLANRKFWIRAGSRLSDTFKP
jgi:hypothetical protein